MREPRRILVWDWLRLTLIIPMVIFHSWQFIFNRDSIHFSHDQSLAYLLTDFFGYFAVFFGVMILAQSFFMFGFFKAPRWKLSRWALLIFGVLLLQVSSVGSPLDPAAWTWDVYSFLLVSLLACVPLAKLGRSRWLVLGLAAIPLMIGDSWWRTGVSSIATDSSFLHFLIGHPAGEFDGWNLVPWLGIPVAMFIAGLQIGEAWRRSAAAFELKFLEGALWILSCIGLFWNYNSRYPIPLGPGFDALVFHLNPHYFWPHFAIFLFLLRLGLDPRLNRWLASAPVIKDASRFVSHMAWCRHFGWAYLVQIALYQGLGEDFYNWNSHPRQFDFLWFGVFLAAELATRSFFNLRARLKAG